MSNRWEVLFFAKPDAGGGFTDAKWFDTQAEAYAAAGIAMLGMTRVTFRNLETSYAETWDRTTENAPRFVQLKPIEPGKKYIIKYRCGSSSGWASGSAQDGLEAVAWVSRQTSEHQIATCYPDPYEIVATYERPKPE